VARPFLFPSKEWCAAAAAAAMRDPEVIAAIADFGPVVAGLVIVGCSAVPAPPVAGKARSSVGCSAVPAPPVAGEARSSVGEGRGSDFCILARIEPGKLPVLSYPDDEDELAEYQPDYLGWASYTLCRSLLEETFAGRRPDPLTAILRGEVRLQGNLEKLVKHAGRHQGAGLEALKTVPTEFV
jgi:hypothetical protein